MARRVTGFVAILTAALFAQSLPALAAAQATPEASGGISQVSAVAIWAAPIEAGTPLAADDPDLGAKLGAALVFTATVFPEPLDDAAFATFQQEALLGLVGPSAPDSATEVPAPDLRDGSAAWTADNGQIGIHALFAYDGATVWTLVAISPSGETDTALLDGVAASALDPARARPAPGIMESFVTGFAGEAGGVVRMLRLLPARADVPERFQPLDEDVLVS